MKKLERLDGKLFESLKLSEMSNLASMVGGLCKETQGTLKIQQGNTLYTKNYLDMLCKSLIVSLRGFVKYQHP